MKSILNKSQLDPKDRLFLSHLAAWKNTQALERLKTVQRGIEYDVNLSGWWIERGSTAHSLANLLGFTLYDPRIGPTPKNPRPERNIWNQT